jgi:hypothetical protein
MQLKKTSNSNQQGIKLGNFPRKPLDKKEPMLPPTFRGLGTFKINMA